VLEELLERRERECRLVSELALQTIDEADAFLRERGLLTRNPSLSLPSLFGACHEEPYKAGSGGFGEWPGTKWPWSFELPRRPGVVAPKVHMGKAVYLGPATARLADPIVRAELDRMRETDADWARASSTTSARRPVDCRRAASSDRSPAGSPLRASATSAGRRERRFRRPGRSRRACRP
jgi:hypothetical protein